MEMNTFVRWFYREWIHWTYLIFEASRYVLSIGWIFWGRVAEEGCKVRVVLSRLATAPEGTHTLVSIHQTCLGESKMPASGQEKSLRNRDRTSWIDIVCSSLIALSKGILWRDPEYWKKEHFIIFHLYSSECLLKTPCSNNHIDGFIDVLKGELSNFH